MNERRTPRSPRGEPAATELSRSPLPTEPAGGAAPLAGLFEQPPASVETCACEFCQILRETILTREQDAIRPDHVREWLELDPADRLPLIEWNAARKRDSAPSAKNEVAP